MMDARPKVANGAVRLTHGVFAAVNAVGVSLKGRGPFVRERCHKATPFCHETGSSAREHRRMSART